MGYKRQVQHLRTRRDLDPCALTPNLRMNAYLQPLSAAYQLDFLMYWTVVNSTFSFTADPPERGELQEFKDINIDWLFALYD